MNRSHRRQHRPRRRCSGGEQIGERAFRRPGGGLRLPGHPVPGALPVQRPQALAQGRQEARVDLARLVKANFGFGGMDVDVHGLGGHAQVHHRPGVPAPGQKPGIDLAQDRPQDTVGHHPAVHQEDLEAGAGQGEIRLGGETRHLPGPLGKSQGEHVGREFRGEDRRHPFQQTRGGRGRKQGPGRGAQAEVDLGVAQGQVAQRPQDLGLSPRPRSSKTSAGPGC